MNIRFNTKTNEGNSLPLRVIITHRGKIYRKSIGISVSQWNNKTQRSGHVMKDKAVKAIRIGLESCLDEFSNETDIEAALSRIERGEWKELSRPRRNDEGIPTFNEFFMEWASREVSARNQNWLTYNIVTGIMGNGYCWSELDSAFYTRLIQGFERRGMRPNYQGVTIGRLKTCLNEAYSLHYMDNCDFRNWAKPHEETFSVALTQNEVDMLWNAELDDKMSKVRDLAILGVYTAARFSDYSKLSKYNIVDDMISFVQVKTSHPVLIPCSPKVKMILERNGGKAPKMVSQVFNRRLKELCKQVGINDIIQVTPTVRKRLKKNEGEVVRKYELISSHTFRRTGASLLYKSGVPIKVCRYLTGHTKDDTFLKYIKIDLEEGARMLSENPFFK